MNPYLLQGIYAILGGCSASLVLLSSQPDAPLKTVLVVGASAAVTGLLQALDALRKQPPGSPPPTQVPAVFLALALALPLVACETPAPMPQTPQQRLYALQAGYTSAVQEMAAYEARPRCDSPGADRLMCSDPQAVEAMRRSDRVVFAALQAARAQPTEPAVSALAEALRALRASIPEIVR